MESILADGRYARLSRYADMNMMMTANGLERTEEDWKDLAKRSGWKIVKIRSLRNAWPCAIEMRPDAQGETVTEDQKTEIKPTVTEIAVKSS